MSAAPLPSSPLSQLQARLQWQASGEPVGNLTLGRGVLEGKPCHIALVVNRIASGALGRAECDKLASLFTVLAAQRGVLVLFLDSAGARVSEGLPALGAFRRMMAQALKAATAGVSMVAVIGNNCYGGASMLAALADRRVFSPHARLAMSGPSILASAAGASALDDAFRAIADVTIGAQGRVKLDPSRHQFQDTPFGLPSAVDVGQLHQSLYVRLQEAKRFAKGETGPSTRKELALLYPEGATLGEQLGMLQGVANAGKDSETQVLGSIDKQPMTAARASQLTSAVLSLLPQRPARLDILIDCETHSALLDDEKLMLSSYLTTLGMALTLLRQGGTHVSTIVLGRAGGGIYVALAAASDEVLLVHGAEIQLLPGKAIAAILGSNDTGPQDAAATIAAGVADRELRIGMVA